MRKIIVAGLMAMLLGCGQGDSILERRPELPNLSDKQLIEHGYRMNGDGLGGYWWEGPSGFEPLGGSSIEYIDRRKE